MISSFSISAKFSPTRFVRVLTALMAGVLLIPAGGMKAASINARSASLSDVSAAVFGKRWRYRHGPCRQRNLVEQTRYLQGDYASRRNDSGFDDWWIARIQAISRRGIFRRE